MYVFLREDEIVSLKVSFTCGVAVCVCDSLRGTRWHIETIISYGAPDSPDLKKKNKTASDWARSVSQSHNCHLWVSDPHKKVWGITDSNQNQNRTCSDYPYKQLK